jgi:hypothetical protein
MDATITKPTEAEVHAAQKVLSEGIDPAGLIEDGYWRPLAEDALVAADEAGRGKALEDALDTLYAIMMMDAGGASERAAETYHDLRGFTREAQR